MDELISSYIADTYTVELAAEILSAFSSLDAFEVDYQENLLEVLAIADEELPETTQDNFYGVIDGSIDLVFRQHGIALAPEARLSQKNEILEALLHLQDTDNIVPILLTLESEQDPVDKFAAILEEVTSIPVETSLVLVQSVETFFLVQLKTLLNQKEHLKQLDENDGDEEKKAIVDNLRIFKKFLDTTSGVMKQSELERYPLGILLVEAGVAANMPLSYYLPMFNKHREEHTHSMEQLALDLLSLIYLSKDGIDQPYPIFTEISRTLFQDTAAIAAVDKEFIRISGEYNGYLGALNEQNRLS